MTLEIDHQEASRIAFEFAEIPFEDHEARKLALAYMNLREANQWLREDVAVKVETIRQRDEMTCDRCGRFHGVVWFAPPDLWNAVMRDGDQGKPDEFSFCCPICFMQLAELRGVLTTGWCVSAVETQTKETS